MTTPTLRESVTECPCCDGALYTTYRDAGGTVHSHISNPKPDVDEEGLHTFCPHCRKRVALIALPRREGEPLRYELSTTQPCNPAK